MALMTKRPATSAVLQLDDPEGGLFPQNHIFEPEYHQEKYAAVGQEISKLPDAFQIGSTNKLSEPIHRGTQPRYADDPNDATTINWEGMFLDDGSIVPESIDDAPTDICVLKSVCVRFGYIDLGTSRSVSRQFYEARKAKAGIIKNDVLVNSTGDGTIGRVAVFNHDFPAVVDGHISILRFNDPDFAWYVAAFLLSDEGQRQIYRYINGSSGQVEIYPQDLARIWVRPVTDKQMKKVATAFRKSCEKHDQFTRELKLALNNLYE